MIKSKETRYYEYMGMSIDQLCQARDDITAARVRYHDKQERLNFIFRELATAYARERAVV